MVTRAQVQKGEEDRDELRSKCSGLYNSIRLLIFMLYGRRGTFYGPED